MGYTTVLTYGTDWVMLSAIMVNTVDSNNYCYQHPIDSVHNVQIGIPESENHVLSLSRYYVEFREQQTEVDTVMR